MPDSGISRSSAIAETTRRPITPYPMTPTFTIPYDLLRGFPVRRIGRKREYQIDIAPANAHICCGQADLRGVRVRAQGLGDFGGIVHADCRRNDEEFLTISKRPNKLLRTGIGFHLTIEKKDGA